MKKLVLLCSLFWVLTPPLLLAQINNSLVWSHKIGSSGQDNVHKIITDVAANIYMVGTFEDSLFGYTSRGGADIFIAKYTAQKQLLWAIALGSSSTDEGYDVVQDLDGNLYLTGYYRADLIHQTDTLFNSGNADAFILKLDSMGQKIWWKKIGYSGQEIGSAIAYSPFDNSLVVVGSFQDSLLYENTVLPSYLSLNNFMLKIDTAGTLNWGQSWSTPIFDNLNAIDIDANGNSYTLGYYRQILLTSTDTFDAKGNNDILLLKHDINGNLIWLREYGGSGFDIGTTLDEQDGFIYMAGVYEDTLHFDSSTSTVSSGRFDALIAKIDSLGNLIWHKSIKGTDDANAYAIQATANHVLLTGYFEKATTFGGDTVTSRTPLHVPADIFLVSYSLNGTFNNQITLGGLGNDIGKGLAFTDSIIYLAATFQDTLYELPQLISAGNTDILLQKYALANLVPIIKTNYTPLSYRLFPNPATEQTFIEIQLEEETWISVLVTDIQGRKVRNSNPYFHPIGKHIIPINLTELQQGIYYITIHTSTSSYSHPLLVH